MPITPKANERDGSFTQKTADFTTFGGLERAGLKAGEWQKAVDPHKAKTTFHHGLAKTRED